MTPDADRTDKTNAKRHQFQPPDRYHARPAWIARELGGADRALLFLIFLYQFSTSILFLWTPYGFSGSFYGLLGLISAFGLGLTGIYSRLMALLWHVGLVIWILAVSTNPTHSHTSESPFLEASPAAVLYLGLSAFVLYRRRKQKVSIDEPDQNDPPRSDLRSLDPRLQRLGAAAQPIVAADRVILIAILLGQVYLSIGLFWLAASGAAEEPAPILYGLGLWGVVSGFALGFLGVRPRMVALLWNATFLLLALLHHLHGGHLVTSSDFYCGLSVFYLAATAFLLYRTTQTRQELAHPSF